MRSRSISSKLTLWFSAVFLLGLVLFGVAMWFDLGLSLRAGRKRTLGRRADRMCELLRTSVSLTAEERAHQFTEFEQATPEGSLIQVFDAVNHRVYPASDAVEFPWPLRRGITEDASYTTCTFLGQPYLVLTRQAVVNGKRLRVFVGGQLSDNQQLLNHFSVGLLATIPALFLLSAFGGYFLSRRALLPVDRLIHSARTISIQNLSGRLPVANTGDELQRLAETCNEMLSRLEAAVMQMKRFTADASHELRSPISFMRTTAECALLNPEIDEESRGAFHAITDESDQAAQLLDDMLSLARADSGGVSLALEPIDLGEILEASRERIGPQAESRSQVLSVTHSGTGRTEVNGDRSSLRQLMWILLDNAVKYTPPGGRIEVRLWADEAKASLSVSDTGIGIPPDDLAHVFERFYRVDSSRSEVSGTGLGLAIAKWIAEMHGAAISVASEQDSGSTFRVDFPLAAGALAARRVSSLAALPFTEEASRMKWIRKARPSTRSDRSW